MCVTERESERGRERERKIPHVDVRLVTGPVPLVGEKVLLVDGGLFHELAQQAGHMRWKN